MPRYDYRCTPCGSSFEITRSINDREPVACPTCGSEAARIFTPVGVVFKGTGFHSTDYRSDNGSSSAKPATESSAASLSCGDGGAQACENCPASGE